MRTAEDLFLKKCYNKYNYDDIKKQLLLGPCEIRQLTQFGSHKVVLVIVLLAISKDKKLAIGVARDLNNLYDFSGIFALSDDGKWYP